MYRVRLILHAVKYHVHYVDLYLLWQQDAEEFLSRGSSREGLVTVRMAELEMAI